MTAETVTIQVPQSLYRRLERLATLTRRPLESLVEQTLSSSLPPLPDDLPSAARDSMLALESLSDVDLWSTMRATFPKTDLEQWEELRERRKARIITADEQTILDGLTQEADLLMLRKAYAAVLLKWRGHSLPSLTDLEAQS